MTWPPEGSKPPSPPRPTPRPAPVSRPASPSETGGEPKVKPQAKPTAPQPPQFQHDGIDPRKALLLLGLPLLAGTVLTLVLVGSPTLWWIAAGVAAAGTAGTVVLRRSGRARAVARRLPGVGRAGAGLRRVSNGRFARSPLGQAVGRAFATGRANRRAAGRRVRAAFPRWMGGTRGQRPGSARTTTPGGSPAGKRAGGRARAAFARLMPGARGRAARAARASAKQAGSGPRPPARTGAPRGKQAASTTGRKTTGGRAGSTTSTSRTHGRPSGGGGSVGKAKAAFAAITAAKAVRRKTSGLGDALGQLRDATTERNTKNNGTTIVRSNRYLPARDTDEHEDQAPAADHAPLTPPTVSDTARKARKLAKQRAKRAKSEPQEGSERDHDPPRSPPASPPPHREASSSTSTNTKHGGKPVSAAKITQQASPSGISAANYAHHITTTPDGRATGWSEAADDARGDAAEFDQKADKKIAAAEEFERTGNQAAAAKCREEGAQLREDASTCRTIAAGYQDEAAKEASSAA